MNDISFSLLEIFAVMGMVQCVYLIVHIVFSPRVFSKSRVPVLYFLFLCAAFTVEFARGHLDFSDYHYFTSQWFLWFSLPPLSYLLCLQLADMNRTPALRHAWVLCLLPLVYALTTLDIHLFNECVIGELCAAKQDFLQVSGLLIGTVSLLLIFSRKGLFKDLNKQKHGRERYWLILSLVLLNACFLMNVLANMADHIPDDQAVLLRNVFGLGFVYLVGTTFLRVIPQNIKATGAHDSQLTPDEREIAGKIEALLTLEKVYQEPTYSRADLARECQVSETAVSRIINIHFGKSFPQIMNEHRIDDAKRLLKETEANIQIIAKEVGFNSLPSFNRVFKDMTGRAPSQFRKQA